MVSKTLQLTVRQNHSDHLHHVTLYPSSVLLAPSQFVFDNQPRSLRTRCWFGPEVLTKHLENAAIILKDPVMSNIKIEKVIHRRRGGFADPRKQPGPFSVVTKVAPHFSDTAPISVMDLLPKSVSYT
jgi:hypothetical protein